MSILSIETQNQNLIFSVSVSLAHLVIQPGPGITDSRGVSERTDGAVDLGQVSSGDYGRGLVVDTNLGQCTLCTGSSPFIFLP